MHARKRRRAPDVVLVALVGGAVDAHARRVDVDGRAVVGPGGARVALVRGRDGECGGGGGRAGESVVCVVGGDGRGILGLGKGRAKRGSFYVYIPTPTSSINIAPRVLPIVARGDDDHHTQVREADDGVVDGGAIRLGVSECVVRLWRGSSDRTHTYQARRVPPPPIPKYLKPLPRERLMTMGVEGEDCFARATMSMPAMT